MKTFYYTVDVINAGGQTTFLLCCKGNENLYNKIDRIVKAGARILSITPHETRKQAINREFAVTMQRKQEEKSE